MRNTACQEYAAEVRGDAAPAAQARARGFILSASQRQSKIWIEPICSDPSTSPRRILLRRRLREFTEFRSAGPGKYARWLKKTLQQRLIFIRMARASLPAATARYKKNRNQELPRL